MLDPVEPNPEAGGGAALSWQQRLKQGLKRTRDVLNTPVSELVMGKSVAPATLEELETALLVSDVGVEATRFLLADLQERIKWAGAEADPAAHLRAAFTQLLAPLEQPLAVEAHKPFVIMLAGVNGAGKTTSIGKLAKYFQTQGHSVLLAAGDTFRAAAREQLVIWGERNNVAVIAQNSGDAAAVIYDAVQAARARGIDIVLADTAGRLTTQHHLMDEIRKVKRVIAKAEPGAPHEVLLVLDANVGQNAVAQVKAFDDALGVTGLILTKLDGTAKGGVIANIALMRASTARRAGERTSAKDVSNGGAVALHPIPIRFIGVGETMDDLRPFVAREFVDALFDT